MNRSPYGGAFGPTLSPLPHGNALPSYPSHGVSEGTNRVPGRLRFRHGRPVPDEDESYNHNLLHGAWLRWVKALSAGDAAAAAEATELLKFAAVSGVTPSLGEELFASLRDAVYAMHPPSATATGGSELAAGDVDNIDWYEPDPNFFYVLDKQSGAQLEALLHDLQHTARYIKRKARPPTRQLYVGKPGNGKTVGARWLGAQLIKRVGIMRIDATMKGEVGGIGKMLRAAFEVARDDVLVIDEFEAVAVPRSNSSSNVGQWSRDTTSGLLQLLDACPPDQIIIGATNHLDLVDEAVRRRMRTHIFFHDPDRDARAAMLRHWWRTSPYDSAAMRRVLDLTEGCSGDALERIAEAATRVAAREEAEDTPISVEHAEGAVQSVVGAGTSPSRGLAPVAPVLGAR